jgi:hypothetical protein
MLARRPAPDPRKSSVAPPALLAPLLALSALCVPPAYAQSEIRLSGVVTSLDGGPLSGAQFQLARSRVRTLSGSDGRYELRGMTAGPDVLVVELIGYKTLEVALDLTGPNERDVQLQIEPVLLETVEVSVSPRTGAIAGFFERRERGAGMFYTREEIGRMQARLVTDVLRRVPGAQLQPVSGPFGTSLELSFGRGSGSAGFRGCPVAYFVDGVAFQVAPDVGINNFVQVHDVAGIEVYSGSSRIPSQFNPSAGRARCGVVAIWTWDGREQPR